MSLHFSKLIRITQITSPCATQKNKGGIGKFEFGPNQQVWQVFQICFFCNLVKCTHVSCNNGAEVEVKITILPSGK